MGDRRLSFTSVPGGSTYVKGTRFFDFNSAAPLQQLRPQQKENMEPPAIPRSRLACDRIQVPKEGPFNSEALQWYCEEAYIPSARLKDFVKGEENRVDFQCMFKIAKTEDAITSRGKKIVRFWCSFGPRDLRGQAVVGTLQTTTGRPTRGKGSRPLAQRSRLGTSQMRGCQCHFAVVYSKQRPGACMIRWGHRNHTDKDGAVCHGLLDPTAKVANAILAPRLSKECKEFVKRLIKSGLRPTPIIHEHMREVKSRCNLSNEQAASYERDMLLNLRDVVNLQTAMHEQSLQYSSDNDATTVKMWADQFPQHVIFYQECEPEECCPFILAWGTEWMQETLATLGQGNAVAMVASFDTNMQDFPLFTILCFDEFHNPIPCCFMLMQRHLASDLSTVLRHVKNKIEIIREESLGLSKEWKPSSFILDDVADEHVAIGEVFPGVLQNLCLWHIRRSLIENLHAKVCDPRIKVAMNGDLTALMSSWDGNSVALSAHFIQNWKFESAFVEFYRSFWHSKILRWVDRDRNHNTYNPITSGAIERWHHSVKVILGASRKGKKCRNLSWLIQILTDVLELFYWFMSNLNHRGRLRSKMIQNYILAVIHKAEEIPDWAVELRELNGNRCAVVCYPGHWHEVWSYGTDAACCSCGQSAQGNTCKHQIKCLLMDGHTETELVQTLGARMSAIYGRGERFNQGGSNDEETLEPLDFSFPLNAVYAIDCLDGDDEAETAEKRKETAEKRKEITAEHFHSIVSDVWEAVKDSKHLLVHAVMKMKSFKQEIVGFKDRSIRGSIPKLLHPFTPADGVDVRTKRRKDLVEILRGKRGKKSGEYREGEGFGTDELE